MKHIFVSSTFRDMHEERDIIHEKVLPELNEYALQYGESVSFCDLRWGVDTEELESEEGARKVLSVCLDEIERCHPYMLVILGERYGWIPDGETMREVCLGRDGVDLEDLEKSVTALEIEYGALKDKEQLRHTLFYFREFAGEIPAGYGKEDERHAAKLSELKGRIRKLAGGGLRTYTVSWDADTGRLKGIDAFAAQAVQDIRQMMEEDWKEYAALSPYEKDQRTQWDLAEQRAEAFRAREGLLEGYLRKLGEGQALLAVSGAAGCGKSTLMGTLAVRLREAGKEVLPVFCGSTMLCNDAMDIIRYIIYFMEERLGMEHFEIGKDADGERRQLVAADGKDAHRDEKGSTLEQWREQLTEVCACYQAKAGNELVILIDAVDQLTADEIRDRLQFIPNNLSGKVKLVCTFLDTFHPGYHSKLKGIEEIHPLRKDDRGAVLDGILASVRRELPQPVRERILAKRSADSPLYLSLAVQRLLMMDREDFGRITARGDGMDAITAYQTEIVDSLPEGLNGLCTAVLHAASEKLGGEMAETAVRYIAASRYGLRESDLEGIFSLRGMEWNSLDFTLFLRYMRSFFQQRDDGRWDFTHRSIREGFLEHMEDVQGLHRDILEHMKRLDENDSVRIAEILYHCYGADDRQYFVDYAGRYEYAKDIIRPAAETAWEICLQDGGGWLCGAIRNGAIRNGERHGAGHNFIGFLCFEIWENSSGSARELDILLGIYWETARLAVSLAERKGSLESLRDLSISYERIGTIYEAKGGAGDLEKALEMYEKGLEIRQELAAEQGTADSQRGLSISYERIGYIHAARGGAEGLEKALEMYEKGLEIAKKLAAEQGTALSQRDLSVSYVKIGDIHKARGGAGELEKALEMYEKGLEIRQELAAEQGTAESQRDLSISYERIGDIHRARGGAGELEKALGMYEKCLEIDKKLAKEQGTAESQRDLSVSYGRIGDIHVARGGAEGLEKALEMYERSLEINKKLAEEQRTALSQQDLSSSYERIGVIYAARGGAEDLGKALEMYERSLEICWELAEERGTAESQRGLSINYNRIGDIYATRGGAEDLGKALEMYEKGLEIAKKLAEKQGTALSQRDLSTSYNRIGDIHAARGGAEGLEKALEMYEKGLEIDKKLAEEQGTAESQRDLSVSYERIGDIHKARGGAGDLGKALEMYEKGLEIRQELAKEQATAESLRDLSVSYGRIGDIHKARGGAGELEKALEMYEKGLEICQELAKEQGTAESLQDLSLSYERIGDIYQARGGTENLEKALNLFEKALEIRQNLAKDEKERETVGNKQGLSASYCRVGIIYEALGGEENIEKALKMHDMSKEISQDLIKERGTIEDWNNYSICYERMGACFRALGGEENLEKALEMYEKCLEICQKLVNEKETVGSREVQSIIYNNVGEIYEELGEAENLKRALGMYEKALEIFRELAKEQGSANNYYSVGLCCGKIGDVLQALGGNQDLESALEMYETCQKIFKRLLVMQGTAEIQTVLSFSYERIAGIYVLKDGFMSKRKARKMYGKCLKIREELAESLGTIQSYDDLAITLYNIAVCPGTKRRIRKQYLERMLSISEMLYQNTGNERYRQFIDTATEEISRL